jgi:hypothetical protein
LLSPGSQAVWSVKSREGVTTVRIERAQGYLGLRYSITVQAPIYRSLRLSLPAFYKDIHSSALGFVIRSAEAQGVLFPKAVRPHTMPAQAEHALLHPIKSCGAELS